MVSRYFQEADPARIAAEYPVGEAFLKGPAKLSRDVLRALQEEPVSYTHLTLPTTPYV